MVFVVQCIITCDGGTAVKSGEAGGFTTGADNDLSGRQEGMDKSRTRGALSLEFRNSRLVEFVEVWPMRYAVLVILIVFAVAVPTAIVLRTRRHRRPGCDMGEEDQGCSGGVAAADFSAPCGDPAATTVSNPTPRSGVVAVPQVVPVPLAPELDVYGTVPCGAEPSSAVSVGEEIPAESEDNLPGRCGDRLNSFVMMPIQPEERRVSSWEQGAISDGAGEFIDASVQARVAHTEGASPAEGAAPSAQESEPVGIATSAGAAVPFTSEPAGIALAVDEALIARTITLLEAGADSGPAMPITMADGNNEVLPSVYASNSGGVHGAAEVAGQGWLCVYTATGRGPGAASETEQQSASAPEAGADYLRAEAECKATGALADGADAATYVGPAPPAATAAQHAENGNRAPALDVPVEGTGSMDSQPAVVVQPPEVSEKPRTLRTYRPTPRIPPPGRNPPQPNGADFSGPPQRICHLSSLGTLHPQ